MRICLLISGLLCCFFMGFAQKQVSVFGIVVDEQNVPVSDVLVSVNWSKKGLLSKADGSFYITANSQDTLVFKHLSFEPKVVALPNNFADTLKVQLTQRTLILDEVQITNWGTWQDFKHKIAEMDADSIRQTDGYRLKSMFDGVGKKIGQSLPSFGGIGFGVAFNISTQSRGYASTMERKKREIRKRNAYRYSEKLLAKVLHLEGKKLKDFKSYCDNFINFDQSDYKMLKQIDSLYKEWQAGAVFHMDESEFLLPEDKYKN